MKIDKQVLKQFGLTRKESEIYITLLQIGDSPIADLIRATKTHPQIIYTVLNSLREKNLIISTEKRHRKYVQAEDPQVLFKNEEKKLSNLKKLLPVLTTLQKPSDEAIVRIKRGNSAVRETREGAINILKSGDILYILGGGAQGIFIDIMRDQHTELERLRVKRGINKKMIAFVNQKEIIEKTNSIGKLSQTKYLNDDFTTPTSLFIYGKFSSTVIWLPEPIVITIESVEVARSNINYFESLWRVAKSA